MIRRITAGLLAFVIMISLIPNSAFAQSNDENDTRASSYLNMYSAALYPKSVSGKVDVAFEVFATGNMERVGVLEIIVRNNDGTIHNIIWGSLSNGLLDTNTWFHAGVYTLNLTSGNTYYCTVVVLARDANGGDTRRITTNHVVCP